MSLQLFTLSIDPSSPPANLHQTSWPFRLQCCICPPTPTLKSQANTGIEQRRVMATASLSLGTIGLKSKLIPAAIQFRNSSLSLCLKTIPTHKSTRSPRRFTIFAVTQGSAKSSNSEENIPSWAKPNSEEPPPWAQDEGKESLQQTFEVPFYVYLIASAITAIAAIGSVFEYINEKPVFGVLNPDSIFYAPLLGFFAFTGVPTSAFLWFKSVEAANKAAEEQDRKDGYR